MFKKSNLKKWRKPLWKSSNLSKLDEEVSEKFSQILTTTTTKR